MNTFSFTRSVDGDDPGVGQLASRARLAREVVKAAGVDPFREQDL